MPVFLRLALRRVVLVSVLAGLVMTVGANAAHASGNTGEELESGFLGLTDSHGNEVSVYELSLDGGGLNVFQQAAVVCLHIQWAFYLFFSAIGIRMLDWILELGWTPVITVPLENLSEILALMIETIGIPALMLLALGCVFGYWWVRGRHGGAIGHLVAGLVIASLATGLLTHPMGFITGEDGALNQARTAGQEIAAAVTLDPETATDTDLVDPVTGDPVNVSTDPDPDEALNGLTAAMVDTMIRTPHQLINYNQVIDGGGCENAYNQSLGEDDAREAVGECDSELQEAAESAGFIRVGATAFLGLALVSFALLSFVVVAIAIGAVAIAAWSMVKLVWDLVVGVVPGPGRGALARSAANLGFGLIMVVLSIAFTAVWMRIVSSVLGANFAIPLVFRYLFISLLICVGVGLLIKMRNRIRDSLHRAAERLASTGPRNAAPAQRPSRGQRASRTLRGAADVGKFGARAYWLASQLRRRPGSGSVEVPGRFRVSQPSPVRPAPPRPLGGGRGRELPAGSDGSRQSAPAGGRPPGSPSPGQRVGLRLGKRVLGAAKWVPGPVGTAARVGNGVVRVGQAARIAGRLGHSLRAGKSKVQGPAQAGKPSRRPAMPRTSRNSALRHRFGNVHERRGSHVVDKTTGATYKTHRIARPGAAPVEVLQPTSPRPGPTAASRLKDRLANNGR